MRGTEVYKEFTYIHCTFNNISLVGINFVRFRQWTVLLAFSENALSNFHCFACSHRSKSIRASCVRDVVGNKKGWSFIWCSSFFRFFGCNQCLSFWNNCFRKFLSVVGAPTTLSICKMESLFWDDDDDDDNTVWNTCSNNNCARATW